MGGAQRTILNVVNGLDKKRYQIKLVMLNKTKNETYLSYLHPSIEYYYLNKKARYSLFSLRKTIKSFKPIFVISTLGYINILTAFSTIFFNNKPFIILRESAYRTFNNKFQSKLYIFAHKIADYSIALSKSVQKNMIENYKISKEKIGVIYNPIDLTFINKKLNKDIDFSFTKKVKLVVAGRLVSVKNHSMVIKALNYFKIHFHDNFELLVLGDGPLKEELYNEVKLYNLQDNIHFLGNVKNPFPYFEKADFMLVSSISEGFGHVIIEAMACKTLVISTDCTGGPREILQDKYGFLVPINDYIKMAQAIHHFYLDQKHYDRVIEMATSRLNDFKLQKIIMDYEKLLARLISTERDDE